MQGINHWCERGRQRRWTASDFRDTCWCLLRSDVPGASRGCGYLWGGACDSQAECGKKRWVSYIRAKGEGCFRNASGTLALVIQEWQAVSGAWFPRWAVDGGGMRQVEERLQRQAQASWALWKQAWASKVLSCWQWETIYDPSESLRNGGCVAVEDVSESQEMGTLARTCLQFPRLLPRSIPSLNFICEVWLCLFEVLKSFAF